VATNPFEDEDGRYFALINDEGQYSLWPTFADVPDGWTVAHDEDTRQACLDYIEENWTDMRPKSLIEQMSKYEKNGRSTNAKKETRNSRSSAQRKRSAPKVVQGAVVKSGDPKESRQEVASQNGA